MMKFDASFFGLKVSKLRFWCNILFFDCWIKQVILLDD